MPAPAPQFLAPRLERSSEVLTPAALELVVTLHRKFNGRRLQLLDGHDGTWVAHPGLAPIATDAFNAVMSGPNQLRVMRSDSILCSAPSLNECSMKSALPESNPAPFPRRCVCSARWSRTTASRNS